MLFIHELFLCCWFSGPVLPHFRLVLAISRVIKIKLTNSCKRKAVAWSSLEGTQRGEIADIKYWLATLESLGPWKGRPWGPYTEVSMKPVSMSPLDNLLRSQSIETWASTFLWFAGDREEKGLKEMSCWYFSLFREWILNVSKNFVGGGNWETLVWVKGKTF